MCVCVCVCVCVNRGGVYVGVYAMWPRTAQGPSVDDDMSHSVWVCECERALGTDVLGLYLNEVRVHTHTHTHRYSADHARRSLS